MSDDMEDVLVTDLRRGMTVDLLSTAAEWGGAPGAAFEFATVEDVEALPDGVMLYTDQQNYKLPTHWTVQWASHLDIEDWQAER